MIQLLFLFYTHTDVMNYIDIVILAPVVWGVYRGFTKGLIIEVASLLALVVGIWCAIHFNELTASFLINDLGWNISDSYLAPVAFAATFLIIALVIVLISRLIDKVLSAVALGGINKLFGALFGGLKALLIVAILAFFVHQIDSKYGFLNKEKKESSVFYERIIAIVEEWIPVIDFGSIKKELPEVKAGPKSLKEI